jgi:hypothetical protein
MQGLKCEVISHRKVKKQFYVNIGYKKVMWSVV